MGANIKTNFKRGIAVGLIAIMAAVNPLQTLQPTGAETPVVAKAAETDKAPYIGEVRLAVDKDPNKAKQILNDAGYEYIDQDLNEKAGSFWNKQGDQAVYLGFKRTADEDKAIRDMKTMNMCGKYSYSDLSKWVKNNRQTAKAKCEPLRIVCDEFKNSVKDGDLIAKKVLEAMNHVVESDSGKGVGDYLLSCDEEGMVKVLVEGNGDLVSVILELLYKGCEYKEDTWLERLSVTSKKSLTKKFAKGLYGVETVYGEQKAEVEKRIKDEYEETAERILENWDSIRDLLVKESVEVEYTPEEQEILDEDEFLDYYMKISSAATEFEKNNLTEELSKMPYNGKTLLDFFSLDKNVFEKDITRLYPMAASLTEGQRSFIEYSGFADLIQTTITRIEGRKTGTIDNLDIDEEKILKDCSLYIGVDRAMFRDGAAMTSDAISDFASSDEFNEGMTAAFYASLFMSVFSMVVTLGLYNAAWIADDFVQELANKSGNVNEKVFGEVEALDEILNNSTEGYAGNMNTEVYNEFYSNARSEFYSRQGQLTQKYADNSFFKARLFLGISLVMSIVTTTLYIINKRDEHNKKQLAIPTVIVDRDVESTISGYVSYSCVLWNKDRYDDTGRDNRGDLNGDAGDQWLAMYTTTDPNMGDPILADSIVAKTGKAGGKNRPGESYLPLTMFGKQSIQNLVDEEYSYHDEVDGIWLWYTKDKAEKKELVDDTDYTGSNIGGGNTILVGLGGGVAGIIVGIFIGFFIRRKKQVI